MTCTRPCSQHHWPHTHADYTSLSFPLRIQILGHLADLRLAQPCDTRALPQLRDRQGDAPGPGVPLPPPVPVAGVHSVTVSTRTDTSAAARLHVLHNWSDDQPTPSPSRTVTDMLGGRRHAPGEKITLRAWDVRLLCSGETRDKTRRTGERTSPCPSRVLASSYRRPAKHRRGSAVIRRQATAR